MKEECNIWAFFKLLSHYALLEKERKNIFDKLIRTYTDSPVSVEMLSQSRIKFEGSMCVTSGLESKIFCSFYSCLFLQIVKVPFT